MNPEVKAKWIEALRSGAYAQTTDTLRADNRFCCLGVLCDLNNPNAWVPLPEDVSEHEGTHTFLGNETILPYDVIQWAELPDDSDGEVLIDPTLLSAETLSKLRFKRNDGMVTLVAINDNGNDFDLIAQVIEEAL